MRVTTTKLAAFSAVAVIGSTFLASGQAFAMNAGSVSPLEVQPLCSAPAQNQLLWTVTNKNDDPVVINWDNINLPGAYGQATAHKGDTVIATSYDSDKSAVSIKFTDPTNTSPLVKNDQMQGVTCSPEQLASVWTPADDCKTADEVTYQDLQASYVDRYHAMVKYVGSTPLCDGEEVQINFTGYVIANPDYNGGYLKDNLTALPQFAYANDTAFLSNQQTELHLFLHNHVNDLGEFLTNNQLEHCIGIQTDIYRGELVTGIFTTEGHGDVNLLSQVYPAQPNEACDVDYTGSDNNGTNNGGNTAPQATGENQAVTTVAATTPVVATKPAELANTGQRSLLPAVIASLLAISAAIVALPLRRRHQA